MSIFPQYPLSTNDFYQKKKNIQNAIPKWKEFISLRDAKGQIRELILIFPFNYQYNNQTSIPSPSRDRHTTTWTSQNNSTSRKDLILKMKHFWSLRSSQHPCFTWTHPLYKFMDSWNEKRSKCKKTKQTKKDNYVCNCYYIPINC